MIFETVGTEIGKLVDEKQAAYGDSFGKAGDVMRILYPNGIAPNQLDDALAIVRVIDKLFRIATKKDAFGENPWKDIVGYGLLGTREKKRAMTKPTENILDAIKKIQEEMKRKEELKKIEKPDYWKMPPQDRQVYLQETIDKKREEDYALIGYKGCSCGPTEILGLAQS